MGALSGCFIRSASRPIRVNCSLFTSRPACLLQCSSAHGACIGPTSVHGAFIGSISVTVGAASVHGAFIGATKSGASLSTFGVGLAVPVLGLALSVPAVLAPTVLVLVVPRSSLSAHLVPKGEGVHGIIK